MSSCNVSSLCIQEILGAFLVMKKLNLMVSKKRVHYLCEDALEKSIPRDHLLLKLGKPDDAK